MACPKSLTVATSLEQWPPVWQFNFGDQIIRVKMLHGILQFIRQQDFIILSHLSSLITVSVPFHIIDDGNVEFNFDHIFLCIHRKTYINNCDHMK